MTAACPPKIQTAIQRGLVFPAHPLALDANRKLDERRQRALSRYYLAAGAGGLALGVHTTQFAIREPAVGLFRPVLEIAKEEFDRADEGRRDPYVRIAGICGNTEQAMGEARLIRELGYHVGLLSLGALQSKSEDELLNHCREIAAVVPLFGFYLQPAAGGRPLSYAFWRRFSEIENVIAIKIAPFNRYQTVDVVRAVAEAGRDDIALYTGNDDNIVADLLTPFRFKVNGALRERRIVGGLLGHWAFWTRAAVDTLLECQGLVRTKRVFPANTLQLNIETTDANAAIFDAANLFRGCIPGIHEVLRRQGLLEGTWCLDSNETLSPGQIEQIDRVYAAYPHLNDDKFVEEHRDEWLTP